MVGPKVRQGLQALGPALFQGPEAEGACPFAVRYSTLCTGSITKSRGLAPADFGPAVTEVSDPGDLRWAGKSWWILKQQAPSALHPALPRGMHALQLQTCHAVCQAWDIFVPVNAAEI